MALGSVAYAEQPAHETAALWVRDLRKRFGDTEVLQGISFTVPEGTIFGLLGPNGAGKTTTLSLLAGLLPPSSGQAYLFGMPMFPHTPEVRRQIGIVPQDIALYPTLTAEENLEFFGSLYGLRGAVLRQRIHEVLEAVGLAAHRRQPVGRFSGGMKRRMNIAAGLLHRPRLLFLDEPTVGVDPQSRTYIFDLIRSLNREHGTTIIYTSHYMEEVELLCERVAILDHGRIIACDTVANILRNAHQALLVRVVGSPEELKASVERLRTVEGVDSAVVQPGDPPQLYVAVRDCAATLPGVVRALDSVEVRGIEVLPASLESVFLMMTGRRLRD
ncbi:MAG: ABC transporter ATP-binding protein [Bacillota bacterium]